MTGGEIAFEVTKIIGVFIGLSLVIWRINLTKKVFEEDHLRRKKESTLTAYHSIRDSYREVNGELCSKLDLKKTHQHQLQMKCWSEYSTKTLIGLK